MWRIAANILNKQSWTAKRGGPPACGLVEVLTTPPREKTLLRNIRKARCFLWRQNNLEVNYSPTRNSGGVFLEEVSRSRKRNRDILLGTWKFRSLYRARALMAAARELARYKLDLVGVQG